MEQQLVDQAMTGLDLSGSEDLPKANRLRIEGNVLYTSGRLELAIPIYHEAHEAAPSNPLSLLNLSAAYFESGNYGKSVHQILLVREHLENRPATTSTLKKAFIRYTKSLLHLRDWEAAQSSLNKDNATAEEITAYKYVISQAKMVWLTFDDTHASLKADDPSKEIQGYKAAVKRLVNSLPGYKVTIANSMLEYYAVGHDSAKSLFDDHLKLSTKPNSFCFSGIGDGRNFFITIISIAKYERQNKRDQPYYITINDLNPCCLARLLVILSLIIELGEVEESQKLSILATLYFVYIGVVMPAKIFDHFQGTISKIIEALQHSDNLFPEQFPIDVRNCQSDVLKHLTYWVSPDNPVPVSDVLRGHCDAQEPGFPPEFSGDVADAEYTVWLETGMLFPPEPFEKDEAELVELVKRAKIPPKKSQVKALEAIEKYLEENWKVNWTMIGYDCWDDLSWSPHSVVDNLYSGEESIIERPTNASRLFEHIAPFFEELSESFKALKGSLTLEFLSGDIVNLAESLRYGILDRPQEYPQMFDRLHLSNIPDYIGGSLTMGIVLAKIVNPGPGNFMTATCLRNTGVWETISDYHYEYSLLRNPTNVNKVLQVQHLKELMEKTSAFDSIFGMPGLSGPFANAKYQYWQRSTMEPLRYSQLLPREHLKTWLFTLFFKLCVPANQIKTPWHSIILPSLNLSIYFRALIHLHEIGYPGHWMSEILVFILENKVLSTARPFQTCPAQVSETEKIPIKKLSTAPYIAEMKTLSVMFQRILPFAILTKLPFLNTIHRYSLNINIKSPPVPSYNLANAILVFYRSSLMSAVAKEGLHKLLNPVVEPTKGPIAPAPKLYAEGLIVISTWEWDVKSSIGRFWMASLEIEMLFAGDDWKAGVWGTIVWEKMHGNAIDVKENLKREEAWFV